MKYHLNCLYIFGVGESDEWHGERCHNMCMCLPGLEIRPMTTCTDKFMALEWGQLLHVLLYVNSWDEKCHYILCLWYWDVTNHYVHDCVPGIDMIRGTT